MPEKGYACAAQLENQAAKGAAAPPWAQFFTVSQDAQGQPKLKCVCCDALLSAANPSDTMSAH